MTIRDDIEWFKTQFAADILPALVGTPLSFDLVCAIAYQESGELWSRLRQRVSREELLRLSVGDTLDTPNRSAFPKNKDALIAFENGQRMFELAHRLLVEMGDATSIERYQRIAENPDKFVHGYGLFQYDLQHFRRDPGFFLEQRWRDIGASVEKLLAELKNALAQLGLEGRQSLTDLQSAFVAIVYNTGFGNFHESDGLRQGHHDGAHFYGENIDRYLQIARTVPTPNITPGAWVAAFRAERSIVDLATAEFEAYNGVDEGVQPLRGRIADYYEAAGGSRSLDPTLDDNAWSAAFVSFCVKRSGAKPDQFKFSLQHSVFVHAAIANRDAGRGVFRGHPVAEYAPHPGDIIHHNRRGAELSFDFARKNSQYKSHSAIVVDFETRGGIRHAVTIGGNEHIPGGSGTVGKKLFPLRSDGLLDETALNPKLISVIENRLASGAALLGRYMVKVRSDLKLRGGPGAEFPVIKPLTNGTPLNVLDFDDRPSGRWALVDLEGDGVKDGYVFADFLEPIA